LAGLVSRPVPQALGLAAAGIIAPAFEPMAKCAWAWSGAFGMPCGAR
jgi:hypothetical protein